MLSILFVFGIEDLTKSNEEEEEKMFEPSNFSWFGVEDIMSGGSISIRGRDAPMSASQQRQHPTAKRCHFLISLWFSKQHKASIHNLHKSSLNTCTVALGQTRDIL